MASDSEDVQIDEPKVLEPSCSSVRGNISEIGNRQVRQKHGMELKRNKKKEKRKRQEERQKTAEALGRDFLCYNFEKTNS